METRNEPLTKRERAELQGYASWPVVAGRAMLFVIAVGAVGLLARRAQSWLGLVQPWWLVPTALFAVLLFIGASRWTGGQQFRRSVRRDLADGLALVHSARVLDAIECEELEDEGPAYFLKLDTGETLALAGQYLTGAGMRGFPWAEFDIRETPHARRFLRIKRRGDSIRPSCVRPPLSLDELKSFDLLASQWRLVPVDFDGLRPVAQQLVAADAPKAAR